MNKKLNISLSGAFNQFFLSTSFNRVILLILFSLAVALNFGCGKRKAPLPPVERVLQKIEIDGFQRGNRINLRWTMPPRNALKSDVSNIARIDVFRLAEPVNSSVTLSEEEFSAKSTLVASVPVEDKDFGRKRFTFDDTLQLTNRNVRLRYAVRVVNSSGQKAAFSNFLLVTPTTKVAEPPTSLNILSIESANKLNWSPPRKNVDGSSEAVNILGYNIYRSESEDAPAALLNKTPVIATNYSDGQFDYGKKYFYFVRSISLGNDGDYLESDESNIVSIISKDIFPPAPPTAVTVAATPTNISIFFATNTENDIAGYRIYRSTERNPAPSQWENITSVLLTANTFQDNEVSAGKTYYYYIIAVDNAGNISQPSEIVSETLP